MLELMPPFNFLTFAKVSVSVSKKFGLKKSLGLGLENFGLEKSLGIGLDEIFWSRHSVVDGVDTGWLGVGSGVVIGGA